MFSIKWSRDFMNRDNPRRITGIIVVVGTNCRSGYCCKDGQRCKYTKTYRRINKRHNRYVDIRNWAQRHLKIKLPWFIYTTTHDVDLSGTDKCPFNKCRRLTCNNCTHSYYDPNLEGCCNIEYEKRLPIDEDSDFVRDWGKHSRCGSFDLHSFYKNYNKHTGELT